MTQISSNKYYINWASGAGSGATPCVEAFNDAVQYVSDSPNFFYSARLAVNVKKVRVWGYRTTNDYSVIFPLPYETQINPTYNPDTNRWEINHTWYNKQMSAGNPFPVIGVGNDGVPLGSGLFHMEVEIDEGHVSNIINQIVTNAAQHTYEGRICARYDYIHGHLVIVIEDTGNGIAKEDLPHIFERFASKSKNGTGLGLPISKELTEQMGLLSGSQFPARC